MIAFQRPVDRCQYAAAAPNNRHSKTDVNTSAGLLQTSFSRTACTPLPTLSWPAPPGCYRLPVAGAAAYATPAISAAVAAVDPSAVAARSSCCKKRERREAHTHVSTDSCTRRRAIGRQLHGTCQPACVQRQPQVHCTAKPIEGSAKYGARICCTVEAALVRGAAVWVTS